MLSELKNGELLARFVEKINAAKTKDAFRYIIGVAACDGRFACYPQQKGVVPDFRFLDSSGKQPFSLIPNRNWLLFYFRPPAVRSNRYTFDELLSAFDSAAINPAGEWTVKIRSIEDVQRLWKIIGVDSAD